MVRETDGMTDGPDDSAATDPVVVSVAAYSAAADSYETIHGPKMADQVGRFAGSLIAPATVLDAGCGPGRDLARFVTLGHHPQGIDLNPTFVAKAGLIAPTIEADLRSVGKHFASESFDGIWACASLVHLAQHEVVDVLGQFARLLRPQGHLYVATKASGTTGWFDELDGRRWYTVWDGNDLTDRITAAGFTVDEVDHGPFVEVWARRT